MNEKFNELPPEKQQRIINAGLGIRAHDYPQASTDDITAKQAEISKGLLFSLLSKNKKEFYLFLFDYRCEFFFRSQVVTEDLLKITDFFDLMEYAARGSNIRLSANILI